MYILTSRIEWTRRLAIVEEIRVWLGAWILVWTQIRVWIWLRVQVGCRHGLGLGFGSDRDPWGFLCNSRESAMDLKYTHVFLTVSYSISSKYMIDWLIDWLFDLWDNRRQQGCCCYTDRPSEFVSVRGRPPRFAGTVAEGMIFYRHGWTCYTYTVILYTKFEVSRCTRYGSINGCAKCGKWGVWGWFGALKFISNVTTWLSAYNLLFNFNRNCAAILYRFRNTASYLSKVVDFNIAPPAFGAPATGDPDVISRRSLASEK